MEIWGLIFAGLGFLVPVMVLSSLEQYRKEQKARHEELMAFLHQITGQAGEIKVVVDRIVGEHKRQGEGQRGSA